MQRNGECSIERVGHTGHAVPWLEPRNLAARSAVTSSARHLLSLLLFPFLETSSITSLLELNGTASGKEF